jgi:hypothetical protein
VYKVSFFPISLPAFFGFCLLDSHSDWGKIESQCSLIWIFLVAKDVEHFSCICLSFVLLFLETAHFTCPFVRLFVLLMFNFFESFIYAEY